MKWEVVVNNRARKVEMFMAVRGNNFSLCFNYDVVHEHVVHLCGE